MKALHKALLVGAVLVGGIGAAQAGDYGSPISGMFNIEIWQGPGDSNINSPNNQAVLGNPLMTSTNLLGDVTYTGPLNFAEGSGGTNTIDAFLTSAGGSYTPPTAAFGHQLSTSNFGTTTVFEITGTGYAGQAGYIAHDDGVTLYQNGVALTPAAAAYPTVLDETAYTLNSSGAFTLVYVEANGLPADLSMNVPEPGSLALLGTALLGIGLAYRRRNRI